MTHENYDFSPILDREMLDAALDYVADRSQELATTVLGAALPIDTLTLFAHYQDEHSFFEGVMLNIGKRSRYSHGATLYVEPRELEIRGHDISLLGVRAPDPERPQVGYADYPVLDLPAFKSTHAGNPFVRPMRSGQGNELVELKHPEFNILGYVVQREQD